MTTNESAPQGATPGSTAESTLNWAHAHAFATWFSRETTSTNTIAKSCLTSTKEFAQPKLFLTERQTAGRGRGENTWATPEGALLSTWLYPLSYAPQPILSPLVGLALFEAARGAFIDVPFNLKAPNDLYVGRQKIAGLLIESVIMGPKVTCAVGLGFNAGAPPVSLGDSASGLAQFLPSDIISKGWSTFLSAWVEGLAHALERARSSELNEGARARLLSALNLHPLLPEKILAVGVLGQLQTRTRLINWHEL